MYYTIIAPKVSSRIFLEMPLENMDIKSCTTKQFYWYKTKYLESNNKRLNEIINKLAYFHRRETCIDFPVASKHHLGDTIFFLVSNQIAFYTFLGFYIIRNSYVDLPLTKKPSFIQACWLHPYARGDNSTFYLVKYLLKQTLNLRIDQPNKVMKYILKKIKI